MEDAGEDVVDEARDDAPEARPPRSKAGILLAGCLVFALLVGSSYAVLESVFGVGLLHRPFEPEAWAAEGLDEGARRRKREAMVSNLVKRHLEAGMPRAQIQELLGPPDADPILAPREEGDWIYSLGATFAERMQFLWWSLTDESGEDLSDFEEVTSILKVRALMIGFDDEDRVDRIEIVET